jgi:hypothetical protein
MQGLALAADPKRPEFWWIFAVVTIVSVAPTLLGLLAVLACKANSCATLGFWKSFFDSLKEVSGFLVVDVSPQLNPLFQILAPVMSVGLATLALVAEKQADPPDESLRVLRRIFGGVFLAFAVIALINLKYFGSSGDSPQYENMSGLIGNPELTKLIAESNTKTLQMAISNALVLAGIIRLEKK